MAVMELHEILKFFLPHELIDNFDLKEKRRSDQPKSTNNRK